MHFFVNKAMGIGNSGVEHAQFYRANRFDEVGLPYKFIFVELIKNLHEAMDSWELKEDQVINMWEFFVLGDTYLERTDLDRVPFKEDITIDHTKTHRIKTIQTSSGVTIVEHMEKSPSKKQKDMLLVSTYRVELFETKTKKRKVMLTYLDDPDRGRVMTNIHLFDVNGEHYYFPNEVLVQRFFFMYLISYFKNVKSFFVDRGEETLTALLGQLPDTIKLIQIVHADHLSDRDVPEHPLWNNYYEYALTHLDGLDRVVVATKLQRQDLLIDFPYADKKIQTIPVGGIRDIQMDTLKDTTKDLQQLPKKFITVSRLASEKHIDIVVRAIVQAREQYPELTLDIYGQGSEDKVIKEVIEELNASEYIKLKGHSNELEKIYPQYDAFISGSYSEGFGLTYIEALNAGLPIVTFKARFGALELVQDGINGYLCDFSRTDPKFSVFCLADGIQKLCQFPLEFYQEKTRLSVADFQDSVIAKKWRVLIDEL
ncbi:accessory Sec system glycosylation protein GtfA [Enterococcus sp. AZ150]|uniref:Accessory Sec system glycosylation protein GtfA n=1 Tax=Enterococcus sulfureus ATCC 49903 TaxID=1140003 RepID=S0NNC7_9ENTE|nr:glycosyltransferase [Enterococcus sulfureus]EOT45967.1 accessory Sec system glycosylation protein GtfA [Enterococcus sulfureus ATCC 49903]EOT82982.1 accessory Sec system glycosylation protein GtfA [Enterococcus sulfureus ATCC 49903]